jgi:signal peptidase
LITHQKDPSMSSPTLFTTLSRQRVASGARTGASVLLSAVAGLAVATLVLAVIATRFLGFHVLTVTSGSMSPGLQRGDVIVSRPADITQVRTGDVVVFQAGRPAVDIVHRVAAITNIEIDTLHRSTGRTTVSHTRLLRTKGDANLLADQQTVDAQHLQGRVWFSAPGVGTVLANSHLQAALPLVALVSGLVWITYEVRARRRPRQARRAGAV